MKTVQLELADGVAVLTLSAPERRNALTFEMVQDIVEALDELRGDPDARALVLTGAGRSFCAGADLSTLESSDQADLRRIYAAFLRVADFPLPTIAAVNGPAVGAGLNLALACDVRLACPNARFVTRFLDLGLHPGGGHTWMLQRAAGPQVAAAMVLLGHELGGERAAEVGLALACVPDGELMAEATQLARGAAVAPRALLERVKSVMRSTSAMTDRDAAVDLELEAQAWSMGEDAFRDRLRALRARIEARSGRP
jgi:enoyl-CoA hydratase